MARLWSSGAELQPTVAAIEYSSLLTTAPAIETGTIRSGAAAYRINNAAALEGFRQIFTSAQGSFFYRFYIYTVAYPTATKSIGGSRITGSDKIAIRMTTTGTLQLYNIEDTAQVGSDSSALSLNTWYRIEMTYDSTTLASTTTSARIDGVEFASGTVDLAATPTIFGNWINASDATLDIIIDDCAINDATGSFENSWPGIGEQIVLRPNGNGDNSDFGGSDGNSTDNYLLVDEVPPTSTDYVEDNTSGQIDDYNLDATPAALASDDTINCVQVGVYAAVDNATGGDPDIVLRIKAAAAGTVEESASLDNNSLTYQGPAPLPANSNYQLTLYDLPGASTTAWTKTDLDAAQAGVREAVTDTHFARVAALWVMVDHKPAGAASLAPSVSDSIAVSESHAESVGTSQVNKSEVVTVAEAITPLVTSFVNVSDAVGVAEAVTAQVVNVISVNETVGVEDYPSYYQDEIAVTESVIVVVEVLVNKSEAITVTESHAEAVGTSQITVSDTIAVSESSTVSIAGDNTLSVNMTETISISDALALAVGTSAINVSENISLAELLFENVSTPQIGASETIIVSESVILAVGTSQISVNDSISLAEYWLLDLPTAGVPVVRTWTLGNRDIDYSLATRDIDFSLRARDIAWSLPDRDIDLNLKVRDIDWSVEER